MALIDSHPILGCAEAKALEAALLRDADAEWRAMQRAGGAIASSLQQDFREIGGWPADARLLVLVGKGHNGGDALLAAAGLLARAPAGRADVVLAFGREALRPLARRALEELANGPAAARVRIVDLPPLKRELPSYAACLDGVFGFQFRAPMDDATSELLAWINTHPRIRLRAAVDLPSGLGEGGNGKTVFRADFTYATGCVKTPVVDPAHAPLVGRVRYLDLGFFDSAACRSLLAGNPGNAEAESPASRLRHFEASAASRVLLPAILAPLGALRPAQSDKRTYGHLLVVGGSLHYPGAVAMTVQAALRSGVGLLTACVPESLVPEYAARWPEAMWVGFRPAAGGGLSPEAVPLILEKAARASALVVGPGLGAAPETLQAVQAVVRRAQVPLVLDADAIRPEIIAAAASPARLVATPHAGEWQRIASVWPASGVLVAKGAPTRVRADSTTYFSFFGGPVLARGGSGDLLAGLIGGLIAQNPEDLPLAAARGVVWHGRAADLLARDQGQVAVQTTQLLNYLSPALPAEA